MGSLANLVELHLADNQLTGEGPVELGNLTNLKVLALCGNELTGTIPTWLGSLANLELLSLSGQPVDRGDSTQLRQPDQPNLVELHLGRQPDLLTGASIPSELGNLSSLTDWIWSFGAT